MRIAFNQVLAAHEVAEFAPLGFGYIVSFLKKMEFPAKCSVETDMDALLTVAPDVVGLSCASADYGLAIARAGEIRKRTHAKIILGGPHISSLPASLAPVFDVGIPGEGEDTFHHVLRVLERTGGLAPADLAEVSGIVYRDGERLVETPARQSIDPLDAVPPPDRAILPPAKRVHIVTGRGCRYACSFCSDRKIWGAYRGFSAERIARELADLARAGHRHIWVLDDLFVEDPVRLVRIADLLEEHEVAGAFTMACTVRASQVTEDLAEMLVRLNVTEVAFGLESGDPDTQARLSEIETPDDTLEALEILERYEIDAKVSAIIGEPEEDPASMRSTFALLADQVVAGRLRAGEVKLLSPLPGTPYWDEANARGLVGDPAGFDWSRLARPWRGLALNPHLLPEAARLVAWDEHLRRLFAGIAQPTIVLAPDDVDLDMELDPALVRAIFLLADDNGVNELIEPGEVEVARFGPADLEAQLRKIAARHGDAPLLLFAPEPTAVTTELVRAMKLTLAGRKADFVSPAEATFPLLARLGPALTLGAAGLAALVHGDEDEAPAGIIDEDAEGLRYLPHENLEEPVPPSGDPLELLDRYADEIEAARGR